MRLKDEQKLASIYTATLSLTYKMGLAGLKISLIAKEANVASSTIYVYFKNKDELLNSLYKKIKTESMSLVNEGIDTLPFKLALKKIWHTSLIYRIGNQHKTQFMLQFLTSPFISEENKQLGNQFLEEVIKLLERGKKELLIKKLETPLLLAAINGLLSQFTLYFDKNETTIKKYSELTFKICWDSIRS